MEINRLYKMKLHENEQMVDNFFIVTRVPGGWLYTQYQTLHTVFVPYNNEFETLGGNFDEESF